MRKFYAALVVIAVATASFMAGRATSGYTPSATMTSDNAPAVNRLQMQLVSGNTHIDSAVSASLPMDKSSPPHGYLVFPSNQ